MSLAPFRDGKQPGENLESFMITSTSVSTFAAAVDVEMVYSVFGGHDKYAEPIDKVPHKIPIVAMTQESLL